MRARARTRRRRRTPAVYTRIRTRSSTYVPRRALGEASCAGRASTSMGEALQFPPPPRTKTFNADALRTYVPAPAPAPAPPRCQLLQCYSIVVSLPGSAYNPSVCSLALSQLARLSLESRLRDSFRPVYRPHLSLSLAVSLNALVVSHILPVSRCDIIAFELAGAGTR